MARKVAITCALNGGHDPRINPAIPITSEQIARDTKAVAKAGAAVVHLHVRDPKTGLGSMDLKLYRETVGRIRDSGCDVILNLTAGAGALFFPGVDEPRIAGPGTDLAATDARISHVEDLRPEMASLPMGTLNRGGPVYLNSEAFILESLQRYRAVNVKPELDVLDGGQITSTKALIEKGLVAPPPVFQFCLGWPGGAQATPEAILYMRSLLPKGALWQAFGRGLDAFPVAAMSILFGGNIRVGLEDTSWMPEGKLAPGNVALIDKVIDLMAILGAEPATPAETRALMGLPAK
jgi:uncharacterized protein (DUF849 family)